MIKRLIIFLFLCTTAYGQADHAIIFEDTLGTANGILVTISGWFSADVD